MISVSCPLLRQVSHDVRDAGFFGNFSYDAMPISIETIDWLDQPILDLSVTHRPSKRSDLSFCVEGDVDEGNLLGLLS